uniref:Putative sulfatase n=1 Tax=viral metagenome TaxID=1070528 RepID=A0A6M3KEI8_9ZZZZ
MDTHSPYKYDSYWEIFYEDSLPTVSGDVRLYDPDLLKGNDGVPDFRKHMTYYDAAIRRVDAAIAPILALADEDTLVVVASDHGDFIGEFDHWFTHAYMSDPSEDYADVCNILRSTALVTSLLLEDIRIKVSLVDMTTTIASWLGLVEQDWWTGTSLVDFYPQEKVAIPVESDDVSLINERLRVLGYIE